MQDDGNLVVYHNPGGAVWATNTFRIGLGVNEVLLVDERLTSANGRFHLILQGDSNLAIYHQGVPIWASNTAGSGATRLVMQSDGNLVLYRSDNVPVWASGTDGRGASWVVIQNDGNLVVYQFGGGATWASGTDVVSSSSLRRGGMLLGGERLISSNGEYELILQQDGNLVLYRRSSSRALWASNTVGSGAARLIMQSDGNLVLYTSNFTPVWASGTDGVTEGTWVQLQDDGNLVIYKDGDVPLWAANTANNRRDINVAIALHRTVPIADRGVYENILRFFADGIYEMSNGMHQVHDVTIYQGGNPSVRIDVRWNASEWPRAAVSGVNRGGTVIFGDVFPFDENPSDGVDDNFYPLAPSGQCGGGYTLAHEFGHYFYGIYDEYDIPGDAFTDLPVQNSVMHDQWRACRPIAENSHLNWLQFSIEQNNTQRNEQHRQYGASAWEVLRRSPDNDPRDGIRIARPIRNHYPELAVAAPQGNQASSIELPAAQPKARVRLNITWVNPVSFSSAESPADNAFTSKVVSLAGSTVAYPEQVPLIASVGITRTIAKANVQATVMNPGGSTSGISLHDDGVAPDAKADDGLYSGLMQYGVAGVHTVTVSFNNGYDHWGYH